ncbi:MAG TPA: phage portal protein [Caulobacteraceae bacterium]|jgi:HK97 family phage portal protein
MQIFGLEITRAKAAPSSALTGPENAFAPVDGRGGGWFPIIREANTGDWQKNIVTSGVSVLQSVWVFRCISLISTDIAKLGIELRQETGGVWRETTSAAFSPVLTTPNSYQNRIQFIENWVISKMTRGNAYVLKERDARNVVVALHVLHPDRVWPLVAPDGSVFYRIGRDLLAGVGEPDPDFPAVPASEIIHDRWNCLFHPLVGLSPIFACGMVALQNVSMQAAMTRLFRNGARPGGILTAPGAISDSTAQRLKDYWENNFTGENAGKVAVLGDGLTFSSLMMTATDAQFIEQMKLSGQTIAASFGVPAYMINLEVYPRSVAIEALMQMYYGQCLQIHVESIELCLHDGLALPPQYDVKFNLDGLLRMDQASQIKALVEGIGGGLYAPNEGREKLSLPPVEGGESPYLQQQNYSLAALAKRDAQNPLANPPPAPGGDTAPDGGAVAETTQDEAANAEQAAGKSWWNEVLAHVDLYLAA